MTREEAIRWLKLLCMKSDLVNEYGELEDTEPYEIAVDLAIEALSEPERKKGEWVEQRLENREGALLVCSRCGGFPPTYEFADRIMFKRSNFCPNCGADMGWKRKETEQ